MLQESVFFQSIEDLLIFKKYQLTRTITILILFWAQLSMAQNYLSDSLQGMLQTANNPMEQIDIYLGLSRIHLVNSGYKTKGLEIAEKALELSREINNKKYEAESLCFVGMLRTNLQLEPQDEFKRAIEIAKLSGDPDAILFATYLYVEFELHDSTAGIALLTDVIDRYKSTANAKNLGNCHKVLAYRYELIGDFAQAEKEYDLAIHYFTEVKNSDNIDPALGRPSTLMIDKGQSNLTQSYAYRSDLWVNMGKYEDAMSSATLAREIAIEANNYSDEAWATFKLANIYNSLQQYDKAIPLYQSVVDMTSKLDEPMTLSQAYQELSKIYDQLGEPEESELRLKKALELSEQNPLAKADILLDFAEIKYGQGLYDESSSLFLQADSIFTGRDDQSRTKTQLGIAKNQLKSGNIERSSSIANEVLAVSAELNDKRLAYEAYMILAESYMKVKEINKALTAGQNALEIANQFDGEKTLGLRSHRLLSEINESIGHFEQSLHHYKMYKSLSDSTITSLAIEQLKKEQVNQRVNDYKREKENAERVSEVLSRQNSLYLLVGTMLLLMLIGGLALVMQLRRARAQLSQQNAQLNQFIHTKDRFFGIVAHDIRSPISALESVDFQIKHYLKRGNFEKIENITELIGSTTQRLNSLLDNLVNWALSQTGMIPYHPTTVSLRNNIEECLELYTAQIKIKGIIVNNEVSPAIAAYADANAFNTIMRNIIGNAMKYCEEGDHIKITAQSKDRWVDLSIQDSGVGMDESTLANIYELKKKSNAGTSGEKGTGLGLTLVKDLVELNRAKINISSVKGSGTEVVISLPQSNS